MMPAKQIKLQNKVNNISTFLSKRKTLFGILFLIFLIPILLFFLSYQKYINHNTKNTSTALKTNIAKANTSQVYRTNGSDKLTASQYHQIDQSLQMLVAQKDPQAALSQLQDLTNIEPAIEHYCHGLAHDIGHAAYKKYGFAGALQYINDICGSGYIHGIIEEYFGNTNDLTSSLQTVCTKDVPIGQTGNCYHGVGHGLMFYTQNNVPLSIKYCDTYQNTTKKVRCSEGVFMENFNSDERFHPSHYLDKNNPFYPCPLQTTIYKDACYFYATDYYLILNPNKYKDAITWCDGAEKDFITTCDRGVGSRAMKYNSGDPKFVEQVCMSANTDDKRHACIDGMISYFLVQYNSLSRAKTLCATLEKDNQPSCYQAVNKRSAMFLN